MIHPPGFGWFGEWPAVEGWNMVTYEVSCDRCRVSVITIVDLLPITIIDVSRGLQRAVVPVASSLLARIVVPFPLVSRWRNEERTDDLAQTPVDHGTSFGVEPQQACPRSLAMLKGSPPRS
jgi:hypothetical protein